ncbi:MAG: ABC transporter substrate-binding protein [Nitrospirales bacterium]|nr:ABC transporter substrate-binding protein [Nitrospira sp.]MDR4500045.1 ABC transporter substrate-binding protein [Nitrospirales bacterium]
MVGIQPFHSQSITLFLGFWLRIAIAGLCLGCAEDPSTPALSFGLASGPANFDPRFATDATSARLNRLLYARLVDFDDATRPIPSLAEWQQLSPTHYRFHLRPQRSAFHHGPRLTAYDVKATYEFVVNPKHHSPHRSSLSLISKIDALSEDIVDFHLKTPDRLFTSYLVIGILPSKLIQQQHPFHSHPIGSGPFAFVERPDDARWRLIRRVDGQMFEFLRIPDPTVRAIKLLAGEISMTQNDLPYEVIAFLEAQNQIRVQRQKGANFTYLGFNLQDPIVGQRSVREAMAHAIDREKIIQYLFQGSAQPANALFPPEHWVGSPHLSGYAYDPVRARQLLQDAGFDRKHPPRITYKTTTDPFRLRLAAILQAQLTEVGFHVSIQSHDWGTFYGDIKAGRFQMYSLSWVGLKTPDIFHYAFHSQSLPPSGANRGHFLDEQTDRLIDQAQSAQDADQQQAIYRRLQSHLLQALPYVPLWFAEHVFIAKQDIQGYRLSSDGNFDGLLEVNPSRPLITATPSRQGRT